MRLGFDPWVGKIPWRRAWHLQGESHRHWRLEGYSPIGSQRVRQDRSYLAWVHAAYINCWQKEVMFERNRGAEEIWMGEHFSNVLFRWASGTCAAGRLWQKQQRPPAPSYLYSMYGIFLFLCLFIFSRGKDKKTQWKASPRKGLLQEFKRRERSQRSVFPVENRGRKGVGSREPRWGLRSWEREAAPTGTQTAPPENTGSIALGKVRAIPNPGERQLSASNHTAARASGLCVKPQKEKPRGFSWPKCAVLVGAPTCRRHSWFWSPSSTASSVGDPESLWTTAALSVKHK